MYQLVILKFEFYFQLFLEKLSIGFSQKLPERLPAELKQT